MMLKAIDTLKASGADRISGRMLKETAESRATSIDMIFTGPEEANFLWSGHFEMVCTHDLHYVYRCDRPPPSMIIILFNDIVIT